MLPVELFLVRRCCLHLVQDKLLGGAEISRGLILEEIGKVSVY